MAEPSAGSVNNWFSLRAATRISVDITPTYGEEGYHFYSLSPLFQQGTGAYSGIQTNGNFGDGIEAGNMFVFSVWNATATHPATGTSVVPFAGEGSGFSLRKKYDWKVGNTYKITIQREAYNSSKAGYRWSSTITDKTTGTSMKLGELTAPTGANTLSNGSAFHERYAGITPSCNNLGSNLEQAGVNFSGLSSDKPVSFYGTPSLNNVFASAACSPYIQTSSSPTSATTIFGYIAPPTRITFPPIYPFAPCMCYTNVSKKTVPKQQKKFTLRPSLSR